MIDLVPYRYPIGAIVTIGGGRPVEGRVTRHPGPYSVEIEGRLVASVTLVTPTKATTNIPEIIPADDDGCFMPNDPIPEAPPVSDQLDLF